jgi:hypothetical protein
VTNRVSFVKQDSFLVKLTAMFSDRLGSGPSRFESATNSAHVITEFSITGYHR